MYWLYYIISYLEESKKNIPLGTSISGHIRPVLWQALQQELSKWMDNQWLLHLNNANSNYAFKSEIKPKNDEHDDNDDDDDHY